MSPTPFTSSFAAIAPRVAGSLSVISSALIIYVILLSRTKLSSIYHRIMFGMSVADIIGSFAMALTTLPMPKHLPREDEFEQYQFAGTRLGNTQTCTAQAFSVYLGFITMFGYNASLCVYYACAIALRMKEKVIRRYIEFMIHLAPITIASGIAISQLRSGGYNPSPWQAWCEAAPYPYNCADPNNDVDCIRGGLPKKASHVVWIILISLGASVITVSLVLVLLYVCRISREIKIADLNATHYQKARGHDSTIAFEIIKEKNIDTKVVVKQSLAYIAALLLTMLFPVLRIVLEPSPLWIDRLMLVTMPAQGIFNFWIFMWHKVYSHLRVNPNTTTGQALREIFCKVNNNEPIFISRLSVVRNTAETGGQNIHIVMDNEDEESVEYTIELPNNPNASTSNTTNNPSFTMPSTTSYSINRSDGNDVLMGGENTTQDGLSEFFEDNSDLSLGGKENSTRSSDISSTRKRGLRRIPLNRSIGDDMLTDEENTTQGGISGFIEDNADLSLGGKENNTRPNCSAFIEDNADLSLGNTQSGDILLSRKEQEV